MAPVRVGRLIGGGSSSTSARSALQCPSVRCNANNRWSHCFGRFLVVDMCCVYPQNVDLLFLWVSVLFDVVFNDRPVVHTCHIVRQVARAASDQ